MSWADYMNEELAKCPEEGVWYKNPIKMKTSLVKQLTTYPIIKRYTRGKAQGVQHGLEYRVWVRPLVLIRSKLHNIITT